MSKPFHIVIVGAGPAGLSTALALAKQPPVSSSPLHITVLELRDGVQTLGGAVNLTPLALRYLDWLGAGGKLRPQASTVSAIELVAHRTGGLLGRLWPDVDAIRAQRQLLVEALRDAIYELSTGNQDPRVDIIYDAKINEMREFGSMDNGGLEITYVKTGASPGKHTLEADVIIGCDGIHSQVRNALVEPGRKKTYSGKCTTYGYADLRKNGANPSELVKSWVRADGCPLITDTTLVTKGNEALLLTYYEPSHEKLYLAFVNPMTEKEDAREGWSVHGADKEGIKRSIRGTFQGGALKCLGEIIDLCEEWFFFPVYMLPQEGDWCKGRAIVIGDAAHAMPPQGEATGVAIEDGVLLARVLSRRATRDIPTLFRDYETLRRPDIQETYKETMARWNAPVPKAWMSGFVMEWMTWGYLKLMGMKKDYFGRDVRNMELPA
ncbi:FAD-dependent oxidoreductase [Metarhizium robertsii]|uniref:Salicylate hydroxylase n=2 Tax=Metarhizium robertsii TaxID=568076 RepID=E9EMN4_METRA|nr:salicylate hydroxylase [Metarhizium robertsii ARSEF 23]EFZ04053.1 salicylate hydroxylase [Metarhizium robertsii ARSEF 23]EXV00980.1 FAD-dependent oxidoreductase [Metarhizium robertsii]